MFGKLVDKASFDLAVKISKVKTRDDNPVEPIKMLSMTVKKAKSAREPEGAADDTAESPPKKQATGA